MSRLAGGGAGAAALLVAVFLAGTLSGAAGMRWLGPDDSEAVVDQRSSRRPDGGPRGERGRRPPGGEDRFLNMLTERLELTEDQRAEVGQVIAESRSASDSLYRSLEPSMREHLEETGRRIRALLSDEQKEEYDVMVQERRRRSRTRGDGGPRGGGGPR